MELSSTPGAEKTDVSSSLLKLLSGSTTLRHYTSSAEDVTSSMANTPEADRFPAANLSFSTPETSSSFVVTADLPRNYSLAESRSDVSTFHPPPRNSSEVTSIVEGSSVAQYGGTSGTYVSHSELSSSNRYMDNLLPTSVNTTSSVLESTEAQPFVTYGDVTSNQSLPNSKTTLNITVQDSLLKNVSSISTDSSRFEATSSSIERLKFSPTTEIFHETSTSAASNTTQSLTELTPTSFAKNGNSSEKTSSGLSAVFRDLVHRGQAEAASTLQPNSPWSGPSESNWTLADAGNVTIINTTTSTTATITTAATTTPTSFLAGFNYYSNVSDVASGNATDLVPTYLLPQELDYDDSTAAMVAKATTLAVLAVAGVAGNALVIWSVVRQRHLHRPPFYYLLSLSLTDLSRAAFCLPLVLMTLLQGSVWRHGGSACDLFAFANSFFVLSSGVSLLDIAADRHLSLIYARSYRRRAGGAVNLVVVLLGWTLAFLVAFPPVIGVGAYAFEASEGQCTLKHKLFRHDNDTLGFLMVFTALMLVSLFIYHRIFLALRAHRRMRPLDYEPARSATWTFVGPGANGQAFINWVNGFGGTNVGNVPNFPRGNPPRTNNNSRVLSLHVARNQHVTRLFFLMTLTFHALWLPYQVLSYWRVFGSEEEIRASFVTAAAWLSYGQVAVCPLVYFSCRGGAARRRSSPRSDPGPDDKHQEYLLESVHRKK